MTIEERLHKYLRMTDSELTDTLFLLREKGFLENDRSLNWLLDLLEVTYHNGWVDSVKYISEKLKTDSIQQLKDEKENKHENSNESE